MIWETNVWAVLEDMFGWHPDWFKADHDDSILHIPDQWKVNGSTNTYTPPFTWPI
jgi:hypothetical protein